MCCGFLRTFPHWILLIMQRGSRSVWVFICLLIFVVKLFEYLLYTLGMSSLLVDAIYELFIYLSTKRKKKREENVIREFRVLFHQAFLYIITVINSRSFDIIYSNIFCDVHHWIVSLIWNRLLYLFCLLKFMA